MYGSSPRHIIFFSALTLLVGSLDPYKPVPDMTYNVFGGTLNPCSVSLVTTVLQLSGRENRCNARLRLVLDISPIDYRETHKNTTHLIQSSKRFQKYKFTLFSIHLFSLKRNLSLSVYLYHQSTYDYTNRPISLRTVCRQLKLSSRRPGTYALYDFLISSTIKTLSYVLT